MFLNFLAGAVSLVLAVSTFIPWVTVWFYSLDGIDSLYGILILLVGLLGVLIAIFQHLSGKMRGRAFILFAAVALICEGLYFKKLASYGTALNEAFALIKELFGETLVQKTQELLGEQWTAVLGVVMNRIGVDTTLSGFDFIGGGLILATACGLILLLTGILIEKNKPVE